MRNSGFGEFELSGRDSLSAQLGDLISPAQAMRIAIEEAHKGSGFVSPNPLVGCVIVDRDHRLLAVGYHRRVGFDHAEVDALKQLAQGFDVSGAHFYVTLEPCAHQGRTPSCARTLASLRPISVTYAVEDPNPLVSGKGADILKSAGVITHRLADRVDIAPEVRSELCEDAEDLAEVFLNFHRTQDLFVAVKVASTLDGQMALESGESKWITGEFAREHVQLLRASYDAVAIGRGTFVSDDPSLNVRHASFPDHENSVVLFDPHGKTLNHLHGSNLLQVRSPERVIVVTSLTASDKNPAGVRVLKAPISSDGEFEMTSLMTALRAVGLTSIMIEGGARTYGAFFRANKVKRLHAFIAPSILGSQHGLAWSSNFGVQSMKDKINLDRPKWQSFEKDLYVSARVR